MEMATSRELRSKRPPFNWASKMPNKVSFNAVKMPLLRGERGGRAGF
jgi:hypothetical protein